MSKPSEAAPLTAEGPAAVSCDRCGHAVGVYEPVVVEAGSARATSRARESGLPLSARYLHRDCHRPL